MELRYKGKKIGEIKNRVFSKLVDDEVHLMRNFGNTPGIQSTIDYHLEEFDEIKIETKKGLIFKSTKDNWLENRFDFDFGYGRQYFMSPRWWNMCFKGVVQKKEIKTKEQIKLL
jgi:hypothetical protein